MSTTHLVEMNVETLNTVQVPESDDAELVEMGQVSVATKGNAGPGKYDGGFGAVFT